MVKKLFLKLSAYLARVLPDTFKKELYRSGPLARLIRGSLNRAAPAGLTEIVIAGGALQGLRMELDLQTEKDFWLGTYETDLQVAVADLVHPGWVAYDVGANIGYISLLLAQAVGEQGRVISFEALPDNVERLKSNIALNQLTARVQVIHGAVGSTSTPVRFLVGPSHGMGKAEGSLGRDVDYKESVEVPGICLDDFVFNQNNPIPRIVKMDIEGGEVLALPGMQRLLQEARPLIFLELHGPEAARSAWDHLTGAGYEIARMTADYPLVPTLEDLDWKAYLVALP